MSQTFRLGLFIVAALAVLVTGVFLIGSRESMFQSTYRLKAEFQNVAGLADGADVRVGGLHQGTVKHIQLPNRPDGQVVVTMDLNKATRDVLNRGSVASIKADGLVGDKYVEISFGSEGEARLKDGETIASQPPVEAPSRPTTDVAMYAPSMYTEPAAKFITPSTPHTRFSPAAEKNSTNARLSPAKSWATNVTKLMASG